MEADILPELSSIETELSNILSVTKSSYENMLTGILNKQEYVELRDIYRKNMMG